MPDALRRATLSYDVAVTRINEGVCPGCERAVDLHNPLIDFCPHCGISLFDHCAKCHARKGAFARFCHACRAKLMAAKQGCKARLPAGAAAKSCSKYFNLGNACLTGIAGPR